MNPKIDQYLVEGCMRCERGGTPECSVHLYPKELVKLREIVLDCGLTEEFKWSQPTYTLNGKNVLIMAVFKAFAFIAFFKGALLKDEKNLLKFPGKNSQSSKRFEFTSVDQIIEQEDVIRAYIHEAIEIEKSGAKVEVKKDLVPMPDELIAELKNDADLNSAWEALTPGRQRGYIYHFAQPKSTEAKLRRINKMRPLIFEGKGWNGR